MADAHILHQIPFRQGLTAQLTALQRMIGHVADQLAQMTGITPVRHPVFLGMGASFAAAALPVRLLRQRGVYAERLLASDITSDLALPPADLVWAISQSGRSTETIQAMPLIEPALRACLVNITDSDLASCCDRRVSLGDEPDSYASTVAFTGTVAALDLIAGAMLGQDWSGQWIGVGDRLSEFRDRAQPLIERIAEDHTDVSCVDIVADGTQTATAEEGALLFREVCRLPATATTTRNYLHGEMESAGTALHIVLGSGREIELATMLAGAGHPCLLLTHVVVPPQPHLTVIRLDDSIHLGEQVVASTMVMQSLAGAFAAVWGIDVEEFVFSNRDTKTSLTAEEQVESAQRSSARTDSATEPAGGSSTHLGSAEADSTNSDHSAKPGRVTGGGNRD
ncbi:MAG: hypothetical protein LBV06_02710 [Propionibacteriaceae bacterium]|jgi:glucosamine--fructose-6-phosphate aminotransferase (isomerizing)|nr:hypothetical protein [Propionibacteriaceae bacterium]